MNQLPDSCTLYRSVGPDELALTEMNATLTGLIEVTQEFHR